MQQHPYEDIIHLPHHISQTHPSMKREDRAAQFAPFAALTGYSDVIAETARYTGERVILTEDEQGRLNDTLLFLSANIDTQKTVLVTYFLPDAKKSGGTYPSIQGTVSHIDPAAGLLHMADGTAIPVQDIIEIHLL